MRKKDSPYHEGEREVHRRLGVEDRATRAGLGIHDFIPEVAAGFARLQSFVVLATVDLARQPRIHVLAGLPGFIDVRDEREMVILPSNGVTDSLRSNLEANGEVGLLLIDFGARNRMRLNGLARFEGLTIHITPEQVYSNCPRFIRQRPPLGAMGEPATDDGIGSLGDPLMTRLGSVDTFFIASAHPEHGVDVSHRGGDPGFLRITSAFSIEFPDHPGNSMFNTLGNLVLNSRASLLALDSEGRAVEILGDAAVQWGRTDGRRSVSMRVRRVLEGDAPLEDSRRRFAP